MSKRVKIVILIAALAAVAAAVLLVVLCRDAAPAAPADPVAARMEDAAYLQKLGRQDQARRAIMKRMAAARDAYRKAEAAGASESELAALKARIAEGAKDLAANRLQSQNIVRDRILADQAAAEQLQKKGK